MGTVGSEACRLGQRVVGLLWKLGEHRGGARLVTLALTALALAFASVALGQRARDCRLPPPHSGRRQSLAARAADESRKPRFAVLVGRSEAILAQYAEHLVAQQ